MAFSSYWWLHGKLSKPAPQVEELDVSNTLAYVTMTGRLK